MRYVTILSQIVLLCGISLVGNEITRFFHFGIPGNILGLGILFLLLECKILSVTWIEDGASFLIAELLLFFIPSAIGVIQFKAILMNQFVSLGVVIALSTLAVVLFVGVLTEAILGCHNKRRQHDSSS